MGRQGSAQSTFPLAAPAYVVEKLKALVFGGRDYQDANRVNGVLDCLHVIRPITLLIDGACHSGGADLLGHQWALANNIPTIRYPVDRSLDGEHGRAPFRRNQRMLDQSRPDFGIGFPGGNGSRDMRDRLIEANVDLLLVKVSSVVYRPREVCPLQGSPSQAR